MDSKTIYQKQHSLPLTQVFAELPNFIALIISALLSKSLIVWLDLLESFGIISRMFFYKSSL